MGDVTLKCPLCCSMTFSSKDLLAEHLSSKIENLSCPICKKKLSSVLQLIDHLNIENCEEPQLHSLPPFQLNQLRTIVFTRNPSEENEPHTTNSLEYKNELANQGSIILTEEDIVTHENEDHIYEDMKPMPSQELFLKDGDSQYVILAQDHDEPILTKQNNDGTISLTSVKDMKMEACDNEPISSSTGDELPDEEDGLYSCNTCGVSFTSVIEHIQNYHNDQDVVVEEPMDDEDSNPIEYVSKTNVPVEKQTSRRVITETGDIVEAPLDKNSSEDSQQEFTIIPPKDQDKLAGPGSKRYLRMNNMCDSVIMDLKVDQKNGPHHKVLIKEVMTKEGEKIKMYHCMFCNVYVSALGDFKQHPCKSSKYACQQCPVTYDNAKSLCAHMKVHKVRSSVTRESLDIYECDICTTEFPTNKSLKLHKRMHDPVKQRQIEAPKNSDFSEMRYLCNICEKMIPVDYKKIHMDSHKNMEKMLNCGICNKKFTSEEYLEMHMNVHNSEKTPPVKQDLSLPYQCTYCDRRFARPHEKVKHERIHTGEKPHSCDICGKSFRVSYCLTLHMRTHTGARPYSCPHCGKRFKAHSVYNHHLLTHSDVRAYKCPFCPKAFKTSVQLAGHRNSHTKPFSCTHCNRPFASLYAVRIHSETHNRANNLKFSCELCGASYARAFALKDHLKQAHKQDVKQETLIKVSSLEISDEFIVP